jgi:protein-S-isoprenylcysteine O-methyltransferase Ste14
MAATTTLPSQNPVPRRRLSPQARVVVWIVRLVLLFVLIRVARNPWPLLHSRVFPAMLLWIGFSVYWSIAGPNSAPAKTPESRVSKWFHQIVLNAALMLLFLPVPGLTGWFLPERLHVLVAVGAIVQAAFILLAVWARRHLGRNWSGEVRIGVDHELVRTGPYRLLRHPIYTAMLGMFLGTAISSSQYHALLGLAILLLAYLRKTRLEEQILQQTFGNEYDAYRRETWALVPLLF